MLNKEKIRWMTKASIYEKREGKTDLRRNEYFLGDYVRGHLLRNLIGITISYILIVGIYMLYKMEDIFTMAANLQIGVLLKEMLLVYLIFVIIYTGIGIILYTWRYQMSRKRLKKYYRMLRLIDKYGERDV
jgi:hypothetical protein